MLGLLSAAFPYASPAQQPVAATPAAKADPRLEIASKIPGTRPDDLRPSPIQGVYELTRGADIAYVSS